MNHSFDPQETIFTPFRLYNGMLLATLYPSEKEAANLLGGFQTHCRTAIQEGKSPQETIDSYFQSHPRAWDKNTQVDLLNRFKKLMTCQKWLLNSLEFSAFKSLHQNPQETLSHLIHQIECNDIEKEAATSISKAEFQLTFSLPKTISSELTHAALFRTLTKALEKKDFKQIQTIFWQLGQTSLEEDSSKSFLERASFFLSHLFETAVPVVHDRYQFLANRFLQAYIQQPALSSPLSTWCQFSCSDCSAYELKELAKKVRSQTINCYLDEISSLKKNLTFHKFPLQLQEIEQKLLATQAAKQHTHHGKSYLPYEKPEELARDLLTIRRALEEQEQGVYIEKIDSFLILLKSHGLGAVHFDLLSSFEDYQTIFSKLIEVGASGITGLPLSPARYSHFKPEDRLKEIEALHKHPVLNWASCQNQLSEEETRWIELHRAIGQIHQTYHGTIGLRYTLDNVKEKRQLLEALYLLRCTAWQTGEIPIDLGITISTPQALNGIVDFMEDLWSDPVYSPHLQKRGNVQYIGWDYSSLIQKQGLFATLWSLYKAVHDLQTWARRKGISLRFYTRSTSPQLEKGAKPYQGAFVQGTTESVLNVASSNKETIDWTLDQLFTAYWQQEIFPQEFAAPPVEDTAFFEEITKHSQAAYQALLEKKEFQELQQLHNVSDVAGFYGLGMALQAIIERANAPEIKAMAAHSPLFRLFLSHCWLMLEKDSLSSINYLETDPHLKEIWKEITEEQKRTRKLILQIIQGAPALPIDQPTHQVEQFRDSITLVNRVIENQKELTPH